MDDKTRNKLWKAVEPEFDRLAAIQQETIGNVVERLVKELKGGTDHVDKARSDQEHKKHK